MPYKYGGPRSKACNACRVRKVKCDEARPTCGRCRRSGKTCEFRDAFDLLHYDETAHASRRAHQLWQKRSTKTDESGASSLASTTSPAATPSTDLKGVLEQPLYELAVQRFFFDYVFQINTPLGRAGYLEYLPDAYPGFVDQPFFLSAFKSTALANFARRCNSRTASNAALTEYGNAIRLTNAALRDPVLVLKDETLLACQLLGFCEIYLSPETAFSSWYAHTRGAAALLEHRGSGILQTPLGPTLFKAVHTQELYKCLRFGLRPTYNPSFVKQVYEPMSAQVHLLVADVATLCAEYMERKSTLPGYEQHASATPLLERAHLLDLRWQRLISNIPWQFSYDRIPKDQYRPLPHWIAPLIRDRRAPVFVHIYSGFGPCFLWNMMRYARVRLHELQILLAEAATQSDEALGSLEVLLQLEDDLSSTVPALLIATEEKELGHSSKGEEISSFRSFLMVRSLMAARMTLVFLARRGLYVEERLAWLKDLFACLHQHLTIFVPPDFDPLDGD
ncbi:Fungal Zn2-Cys6 binuclear cluster domain-containing protein [Cladophialophora immunda]|nr:Fungal Zn2-Cys6 binuclear cluster domain-containing protein [Cladophialophora immunda]